MKGIVYSIVRIYLAKDRLRKNTKNYTRSGNTIYFIEFKWNRDRKRTKTANKQHTTATVRFHSVTNDTYTEK